MAASYGSGGLITDNAAISRWLDRVERKTQLSEQRESFHLYYRGELSYAELMARHPELTANTKRVAS